MDEIVKEFLIETYENLDQLDKALVELEKDPRHPASLASIFRAIHTLKGTCGFFGFSKLERVAHVGENLLSRLRDGSMILNPEITSALLAMLDAIRKVLSIIESTGGEGEENYAGLIQTLTQLNSSGKADRAALQSSPPEPLPVLVSAKALPPVPPAEAPAVPGPSPSAAPGRPPAAISPAAQETPPSALAPENRPAQTSPIPSQEASPPPSRLPRQSTRVRTPKAATERRPRSRVPPASPTATFA